MHRTQLLLEEWQVDGLRSRAEERGESISSLVREAVSKYLTEGRPGSSGSLEDLRGLGRDTGLGGRDHDRALYGPIRKEAPARAAGKTRRR